MFTSTACAGASCQQTDRTKRGAAAREQAVAAGPRRASLRPRPAWDRPPAARYPAQRQAVPRLHANRVHRPPFPPAQCSDLLPANPTAKSAGRNSALQSIYFALQLKKRVLSLTPRPLPQPTAVSSPPHRAAERSPRAFLDPLPLGMATSTLLASVAWPGWG